MSRISLAQQLAQLEKPAPVDHDPEGDIEPQTASEQRADASATEHYLDVGPSSLRKLADSISDPKYEGVKVTRKQMMESDEDEDEDPAHGNVPDGDDSNSAEELSENEQDLHTAPSGRTQSGAYHSPPTNVSPPEHSEDDVLGTTLKRTREEERKKGKAVARQLAMYDSLLDARIRLQKCVSSINMLPDSTRIPSYLMTQEARAASDKLLQEALAFSDELFSQREKLLISNESLTPPPHKRHKLSEENNAENAPERDWEEELNEHTRHANSLEASFHPHLLTTLQKWSNKVLAIAPSALLPSSHTKFSRPAANQSKSAVQLVDETLRERERLVSRTRVFRGKGTRLGGQTSSPEAAESKAQPNAEEYADVDIFDDTDFYQQLLRDVIDSRSGAGVSGSGLDGISENWRAVQKQRKSKKVVDTRASKGRKLRYEVHEKLQNFMAPVPAPAGAAITWHEAQIDELFASLLGRGFEDAPMRGLANGVHEIRVGGDDATEGAEGETMEVDPNGLQGFRVFG